MSSEKTTAVILRVVEFSEASCVLTLFSREFGKLRGIAKGARRPKGPFESAIDLLALCRIVFLRKSGDVLDLLTEAKLERRFRVSRGNLAALHAGYYVAELLNELTDDDDPHPELFDAANETLSALGGRTPPEVPIEDKPLAPLETTASSDQPIHGEPAERPPCGAGRVARLVLRFEFTALRLLGHMPLLDACVECGRAVECRGRTAFGHLAGGVLCATCRPGQRKVVSVSEKAMRWMRRLADPQDRSWQEVDIEPAVRGELRGLMNHYIAHLAGRELKMHRWLK